METQTTFAAEVVGKRNAVEIVCVANGYLVTTGYSFQHNGRDVPNGFVFESFDSLTRWLHSNLVLHPVLTRRNRAPST